MKLHLPRPYPDELVGSMLLRANRQTGLGYKALLQVLTRTSNTTHPATITKYHSVAEAFGYELDTFLSLHTVFPYVSAFWEGNARSTVLKKILEPNSKVNVAFISQNAGKTVNMLRFCPECVAEDIKKFGESYWRRAHNLPAVDCCATHKISLLETKFEVNRILKTSPPSQRLNGRLVNSRLTAEKSIKLAEISEAALREKFSLANTTSEYRSKAISLGYGLYASDILTEVLSRDFQTFYGEDYLKSLGCGIEGTTRPWVSCLVGTMNSHWTAVRHVLLLTFFSSHPTPSIKPTEHLARKKPRHIDWASVEKNAIKSINQQLTTHKKTGTRTTVKELLTAAGVYGTYGHNRHRFPELESLLIAFKASPQSERQTGKRPRKKSMKPNKTPN